MNEVYENNMRFLPLLKFLDKYKKYFIAIVLLIILVISYFVINNQITKTNNENAAKIYDQWLVEVSKESPDSDAIDSILNNLISNYKNSGYTKIAILMKANIDANKNDLENALVNFKILMQLTDGFGGNKVLNKIARVSIARIELSNNHYDKALDAIQNYSNIDSNAYIHELAGDILVKQDKLELAKKQYEKALEKYTDQNSSSILNIKIANLDS